MTAQTTPSEKPLGSCSKVPLLPSHYLTITVIMGLMGAFYWAIRGTGGYGGGQGALLAGLGWGTLWYLFSCLDGTSRQRPYGSARMIAAITFGVGIGGMTGYGVYIAWLQGKFYLNYPDGVRDVAAWTGYAMLFFCGLHWGGIAGAFMAWVAPRTPLGRNGWLARIGAGILGAVIAGFVVRLFPQLFLPFYNEGIYQIEANKTCVRALGSIHNIAPHVGLFLGFLTFEAVRRDWRAVGMMTLVALGFATAFTVGGIWQTYQGSELKLDWWKYWEMSIGLGGGLSIGLAFYLFNRPESGMTQPITRKERIWGAAFPVWLVGSLTMMNAYKGFIRIHEIDGGGNTRVLVSLIILAPMTVLFLWLIRNAYKDSSTLPLPLWICGLIQAIIIICGYLVSIHIPFHLWSSTLLIMYTFYITTSLIMFLLMLRCRATCTVLT